MKNIVDGDTTELLKMAVRMPDALQTSVENISSDEFELLLKHIYLAVDDLQKFRIEEGTVLKKDFVFRIQNIRVLLKKIEGLDAERMLLIRERLEKAIAEIRNVDANRFEQELIFYIEKLTCG